MTQYLISVIHDADGPDWATSATPEEIQQVMGAVDAFNEDLRAQGSWVFAGGLEPPSTATDCGLFNCVLSLPACPVPATLVMTPFATLRTVLLPVSAM